MKGSNRALLHCYDLWLMPLRLQITLNPDGSLTTGPTSAYSNVGDCSSASFFQGAAPGWGGPGSGQFYPEPVPYGKLPPGLNTSFLQIFTEIKPGNNIEVGFEVAAGGEDP